MGDRNPQSTQAPLFTTITETFSTGNDGSSLAAIYKIVTTSRLPAPLTSSESTSSLPTSSSNPTPASAPTDAVNGIPTSVVIGASVGAAIGAILLGFLALFLYKKVRRMRNSKRMRPSAEKEWIPSGIVPFAANIGGSRRRRSLPELEDTGCKELDGTGIAVELAAERTVYELAASASRKSAGGECRDSIENMITTGDSDEGRDVASKPLM
ncbi:hypothetical protein BJ508DRAFT_68060 [Ascobolus immersus RN42]|uniref:Mid2 domain-containing protein n=1 Tax=Ascobolus immersus RN42 TaxID=1160509 RepID=A0A3N4HLL8_ASCIM|nr:hypothetical protein BJ508DRAFT_68060 [Ascobolus immersus RN42]